MTGCSTCGAALWPGDTQCTACGSPAGAESAWATTRMPQGGAQPAGPPPPPSGWGPPDAPPSAWGPPPQQQQPPGWGPPAPQQGWGQPPQQLPRPSTGMRPGVIAAIAMTVVVIVGGGIGAWVLLSNDKKAPTPAPITSTSRPGPSPTSRPLVPTTAPAPVAAGGVTLSAKAAAEPGADLIAATLRKYFDGINTRNYQEWSSTVVASRAAALPEAKFQKDYATTSDTNIQVSDIRTTGPDTAIVDLTFVSTQAVENAPSALPVPRICWTQHIPVQGVSSSPQLGTPASGSTQMAAC